MRLTAARTGSFSIDELDTADATAYAPASLQRSRHRSSHAIQTDYAPPAAGASRYAHRNRCVAALCLRAECEFSAPFESYEAIPFSIGVGIEALPSMSSQRSFAVARDLSSCLLLRAFMLLNRRFRSHKR